MKVEINSPAYGAFRGGKQDIAAVTVTRDGENITISFENTKGREIPAHIVLPASIAEQLIHAINCSREKLIAEHSGIQLLETWADGQMDIVLRITDAEAAEVWRDERFENWLIAAGVSDECTFVDSYHIHDAEGDGWVLAYGYEAYASDDPQDHTIIADDILCPDGGKEPLITLFEKNTVVFRNIYR